MFDDLNDFIHSNPDARELKRAVAVKMFLKGYKQREIGESLGVSSGFISKWTRAYEQLGVSGLKLGYFGSVGALEPEQQQSVLRWLKSKNYWNLGELQGYISWQLLDEALERILGGSRSYWYLGRDPLIYRVYNQKQQLAADGGRLLYFQPAEYYRQLAPVKIMSPTSNSEQEDEDDIPW